MMFKNQAFFILTRNSTSFFKNMRSAEHEAFFNFKRMYEWSRQYKNTLNTLGMSLLDITKGYDFQDE